MDSNSQISILSSSQFITGGYLLLVEEEPIVQDKFKKVLQRRGYSVRQAYTLAEARAAMAEEPPRAIILDVGLPDGSGLDFLRELRELSNVPVLLVGAMGASEDIVRGFEAGSDDYLQKPYDLPIFLMRIEALLRRASIVPDTLVLGSLKLEPASGIALLYGKNMMLPQKEYSLLQQFVQYPGKVLSAGYLYEKVWGQKMIDDGTSLKVSLSRLRTKLTNSEYTITASRGEGYYFERK